MSVSGSPLSEEIKTIPRAFDEDRAQRLLDKLSDQGRDDLKAHERDLVYGVGGCSPHFARLIALCDIELRSVFDSPPRELLNQSMQRIETVARTADTTDIARLLRREKALVSLVLGLCEIAGAMDPLEAGAAFSTFADASCNAALRASLIALQKKGFRPRNVDRPEEDCGIAILAMGKLGSCELNFSSDIDLIALFDPMADALQAGDGAKVLAVQAVRATVGLLNDQTPDGYVFRTDLRLRPDPGVTAAAVSVDAAEAYYEIHGQNWERAAFIRARCNAGDTTLGEAFLKRLRPFIWRKYLDFAAIEDIHSIMRQIHDAKGGAEIEFHGHNIKTGRGGIRSIEFLVQTQQLIHGGKDETLRARPTMRALRTLTAAGHVDPDDATRLKENYRSLRRIEHRLQMIDDQQTHSLPESDERATQLACFLGFENLAAFRENIVGTLTSVSRRFSGVFEQDMSLASELGPLSFTGVEENPDTLNTLKNMGFADPRLVAETVRRWHFGEIRATRGRRARELLTSITPRLLKELSSADRPDEAFQSFDLFLKHLPSGVQIFSLFAHNPAVFETLSHLMTMSPYLGRLMGKRAELVEAFIEQSWPAPFPTEHELECDLAQALEVPSPYDEAFERKLNHSRTWFGTCNFDTSAQLLLGHVSVEDAAEQFTRIADTVIRGMLLAAKEEMISRHGSIEGEVCVVGLGRLGQRSMTALSDVDLMVVYCTAPDAVSDGKKPLVGSQYYTRLVRRFVTALSSPTQHGKIYDVDMQLRPSGAAGPIAVSLDALQQYYDRDAWTWERMALCKARIIAGDNRLAGRIRGRIESALSPSASSQKTASDVLDMRGRLLAAKPSRSVWDIKTFQGGLREIDFFLQLNMLTTSGETSPKLLSPPTTLRMIDWVLQAGNITLRQADCLRAAHGAFETLIQLSRVMSGGLFDPDNSGAAVKNRLLTGLGVKTIASAERLLCDHAENVNLIFREGIEAHLNGAKTP
ncbi:MAG: bifunctional [glutamine synthetase] adenylyltransferase/[glutamine synthetase]-adenylyl-L-tyrosine phosphorylase [Pseudomonadota bacterium]